MLNDCRYNEIKLLHELSKLVWFIDKHCEKDAKSGCHESCGETLANLKQTLESYIEKIDKKL